jgi:flagellar motor switch protein FliM
MQRVLNQEEIDAIVQAARGQPSSASKEEKSVQACDFRQAGQLSRELAQAISGMFEGFARNLSQALGLYLPVPVQALLVSVEQLTYKDFLVRTPEVTYTNAMSQVSDEQNTLNEQNTNLKAQENTLVGADMTRAALAVTQAQTANQAVLAAAAKVLPVSLLDYLK